MQDRANARQLDVEWRLNGVRTIETDRDLLALVIHNVLDNVVAHANDEGRVVVSSAADNGEVELIVTNTGCTLPADRVCRVFDRFWRGDPTCRNSNDVHCGLGLPLSKAVVGRLGGSIAARVSSLRPPPQLFVVGSVSKRRRHGERVGVGVAHPSRRQRWVAFSSLATLVRPPGEVLAVRPEPA